MRQRPSFLKIGNKPNAGRSEDAPYRMQDYKPLLGLWLIDLSLTRRWVEKPPCGSLGGTFCDGALPTAYRCLTMGWQVCCLR